MLRPLLLLLQVVMLSILGFGALTKPLLAAMLKDTDTPIIDQLRTIPLLRCHQQDCHTATITNIFCLTAGPCRQLCW